jgi:hypothetical protein
MVMPFFGAQSCPYCKEILNLKSPTDLLSHFLQNHRNILATNFTCPACLGIKIFNRTNYVAHYDQEHAETSILMSTLTENRLHARLQQGMILALMITMANIEQLPAISNDEYYASLIGGYTTGPPQALGKAIQTLQENCLNYVIQTGKEWIQEHLPTRNHPTNHPQYQTKTPEPARRVRLPSQEPFSPSNRHNRDASTRRSESAHRNRFSEDDRRRRSPTRSLSPDDRSYQTRRPRSTATVTPLIRNQPARRPRTEILDISDHEDYPSSARHRPQRYSRHMQRPDSPNYEDDTPAPPAYSLPIASTLDDNFDTVPTIQVRSPLSVAMAALSEVPPTPDQTEQPLPQRTKVARSPNSGPNEQNNTTTQPMSTTPPPEIAHPLPTPTITFESIDFATQFDLPSSLQLYATAIEPISPMSMYDSAQQSPSPLAPVNQATRTNLN